MRIGLAALIAAAISAGGAAAAKTGSEELAALAHAVDQAGCDADRAKRLTRRKDFDQMGSAERSLAWSIVAMCDPKAQEDALLKATVEPDALAFAWSMRAADLARRGKLTEAVAALDNAVDRRSDETFTLDDDFAFDLAQALRGDDQTYSRYAWALYRADWRPKDPFYGGDWIWVKLARLLVEAGQADSARQVLERVEAPEDLLGVSLDKRFDGLGAPPERFELVGVTERVLAEHRSLLAERPRDGMGIITVSMRLRMLGRQQEALELVDQALATAELIFDDDGGDHRNWVVNERAVLLMELGRHDEAVRAMQAAAQMKESGEATNVSQTINLASFLNSAGRHDEAIAVLAAFDRLPTKVASPYGWMWIWTERTCAYTRLGRQQEAANALALTSANAKENQKARLKALLCVGDTEGAAQSLMTRLEDREDRIRALITLSRYKVPAARTAFGGELAAQMEKVRARPDVLQAVAAVGRTREISLFSTGAMDAF